MAEFAIRFYRNEAWEKRFQRAGINKPAGMVTSSVRFSKRSDAQHTADRINSEGPEFPCEVVALK